MPLRHLMLIFLIIFSWGLSYVATKIGLQELPPLLFVVLRFSLLILPALFIPFPKIKLSSLALYSFFMCFGQFVFLFMGIKLGMPAGLASLIMQSQAFFTVIMGAFFLKEYVKPQALLGLGIAIIGISIIGCDTRTDMTITGLFLTLLSALSWAVGNILIKRLQPVNTVSLTVWGTVLSLIPLLAASIIFEGVDTIITAIKNMSLVTLLAALYLGFIATLLAYCLWAKMLTIYATNLIAPFSLLVPVIGISSTAYFLNEHLTTYEVIGSIIIMLGLSINIFGYKIVAIVKAFK